MLGADNPVNCPIRIGVSGAHGVGKSTFCADLRVCLQEIRSKDCRIEVVADVARTLLKQGVGINKNTREEEYPLFFDLHLRNILSERSADFVIFDRTILDSVAYAGVNEHLHPNWLSFVKSVTSYIAQQFEFYFFIPIEFALERDGVRPSEKDYQHAIEREIKSLLDEIHRPAIELIGGREMRVQQAVKIICGAQYEISR